MEHGAIVGSLIGLVSGLASRSFSGSSTDVFPSDASWLPPGRSTRSIASVHTVEVPLCLYGRHVSTSFLDPVFGAMMKQACRQTLKSLAAECLVGVRLGLLNFLTPVCVD